MPPLESRAAILEKLAVGMEGSAAAYLGYFAAEARSALEKPLSLPGPTGERNELSTAPRGTFACVAADPDILLAQAAAAFVTGNHVVVVGNEAEALAKRFGVPGIVVPVPPGSSATLDELATDPAIDGMAFAGPLQLATRLAKTLAAGDGALRPLIHWQPTGNGIGSTAPGSPAYLHRFLTEKTISNDTTASGGNASLLALGGGA